MSEEEKLAIELLKQEPDFSLNYYNRENAIDIVLNLIEKQQKEIKDLNEKIIELKEKEIIKKSLIPTQEKFEDYYNYISKDKIREKIEFYKRYGKIKNSNEYVMSVEIFVLEELLEGDK